MSAQDPRIGFIGLGLMGTPIAMKLIERGVASPLGPLRLEVGAGDCGRSEGCRDAASARRGRRCGHAMRDGCPGGRSGGFRRRRHRSRAARGSILIDHSSIRPSSTREMVTAAAASGTDSMRLSRAVSRAS